MSETKTALRWSDASLRKIARQFWADGVAHCPVDGAKLAILKDRTQPKARLAAVHCRRCLRHAEGVE